MKNIEISKFLQSRIEAGDFPSAVYLVAEKGEIILQDALGLAVVEPQKIEAEIDTIYDLASLTKTLVAGLLSAKLAEKGVLNLREKVSVYLPQFDSQDKREITVENLLLHNSGLPAWKPFYLFCGADYFDVLTAINKTPIENATNSKIVYSDLNFLTIKYIVEKIYSEDQNDFFKIDQIAESEIFRPLKLQKTFYNPPKILRKKIAASEFGNEYEKNICRELNYETSNYKWRDYQVWGEVHDGNCFFLKGVSSHAGLFSTALETFLIAQQFLENQTTLLKPETCKLFSTNLTANLNEARSIAFQIAETPDSTASEALQKNSFGHLGFTGTSLWIEPQSERIFILLTNRTHVHAPPFVNINQVRRRFHEIAAHFFKNNV